MAATNALQVVSLLAQANELTSLIFKLLYFNLKIKKNMIFTNKINSLLCTISLYLFFSLNAKAQIPTTHYNIDISNLSTTSLSANDVLTFSLTTRIYSGDPNTQCPGLEIFLQDLQYQINLGSIDTIWFSDIRDNGTIGQIATSNGGTVTVQVADVVDADNESLGTTAGSNPATLAFCGDGEHNACTCGDTSVSGPCVTGTCPKSYPIPDITFVITYAIPSTVPTGTYTITATESMDVYFGYAAPMLIQSNNTVSYPETYQPPRTFDVVAPTPMELCLGDTIDLSVPAYLVGSGAVTWYKDNTVIWRKRSNICSHRDRHIFRHDF